MNVRRLTAQALIISSFVCATANANTVVGAGLGAVVGAAVGQHNGGREGAVLGGAIGGAVGAGIGHEIESRSHNNSRPDYSNDHRTYSSYDYHPHSHHYGGYGRHPHHKIVVIEKRYHHAPPRHFKKHYKNRHTFFAYR